MFVSETSMFNPPTMRLRVTNMQGCDLVLDIRTECTVDELKIIVVGHLGEGNGAGVSDSSKASLYHRLLLVRLGKHLSEENTLLQEGVEDNDELILVKKRIPQPVFDNIAAKKEDVPDQDDIKKLTEGVTSLHMDREPLEIMNSIDFQAELRKILISLIDAAQKILCLNPEASRIFKEAQKYLEEQKDDTSSPKQKIDEGQLKQLTDMGFPEERARKALISKRMNVTEAVQWLFENEGEPLEESCSDSAIPDHSSQEVGAVGGGIMGESVSDSQQDFSKLTGAKKVANMLESFRAFRRREFRPNPRAMKNLTDMGFPEKDVLDALRISGNKEEEACEWLLNGNKTIEDKDLEEGLDTEGPIYKAIMANPVVQLGLNNPRSLLAFLHMLENPSNTHQWLNDPDTGPMLIQISRIYHAEKHAPT